MLIKFNGRQQIAIIASFVRFTKTHPSLRRSVWFSGFSQPIESLLYFWHPTWCEPSREYFPWKANNHLLVEYPLTQPDSLVSSKMIIIVWLMESQITPFFFIMIVKLLQVEQFVTLPDQIRGTNHIYPTIQLTQNEGYPIMKTSTSKSSQKLLKLAYISVWFQWNRICLLNWDSI